MVDIGSDDPRKAVIFNFSSSTPAAEIGAEPGQGLELPTNVREVFTIPEKALVERTNQCFSINDTLRHYAKQAPKCRCEIGPLAQSSQQTGSFKIFVPAPAFPFYVYLA